MQRRLLWAIGTLALLAAASWLPARVVQTASGSTAAPAPPPATIAPPIDLARPALAAPAAIPADPSSALAAVRSYFFSLSWAGDVDGEAAGNGQRPYAAAYAYLDPAWRARLPFARFVETWRGVAHLDLLQAVDAGPVTGDAQARRVYVEVREYLVLPERQVVGFADGIFIARRSARGWLLTDGALQPENVVSAAFFPTGARQDAAATARAFVAAGGGPAPTSGPVERDGRLATVVVTVPAQPGSPRRVLRVHLAERVDGTWAPLYAQRID